MAFVAECALRQLAAGNSLLSALGGRHSHLDLGVLEIAVGLPWSPEVAAEHLRLWEVLRPDGFMMTGSQLQLYEQTGEDIGIDFGALLEGAILAF